MKSKDCTIAFPPTLIQGIIYKKKTEFSPGLPEK